MSTLPDKQLLRRGDVMRFLDISRQTATKMVECGTLEPVYLTPGGKAYFTRVNVLAIASGKVPVPTAAAGGGAPNHNPLPTQNSCARKSKTVNRKSPKP